MFEAIGTRSSFRYLASVIAVWYFYKHFIRPYLSPLRKIPGRPYIPFLGNMLETIRQGANNNGIRWMQMHDSRIIRFYFLGGEGAVLVGDPAMAKQILVSNSKNYHRPISRALNKLIPGFLVLVSGEKHHALRRLVNPVFSSRSIEDFFPSFEATAKKLVEKWSGIINACGGSGVIEAQNYMSRLTLDAICECGFNYDMKALEDDQRPEVKAFNHILGGLELSTLTLLNLNWLPTERNRQIWSDVCVFKSCINQVIASKQEKMKGGLYSKDILSQLLTARDDNGQALTKDMLYSNVGGFLFAGYETTSTSLTWTLLELATRPEVQDRARQEVRKLLPDKTTPITPGIMEKMEYLSGTLKEAIRHHSPISTIFRRAIHGDYLGGYYIPPGTLVGININAIHRLPEIWENTEEFRPERFSEYYDKYAFLPFSAGPYMCVGMQFSMIEALIALASILRHFSFRLPADYDFKVVRKLTVQPSPPLRLIVEPLKE